MSPAARFRLALGIIIVILLVFGLTVYLNHTMSLAHSSKAQLAATNVSIGTDYAGLVAKQNVTVGDKVTKGQVLFEIQSTQLNQALTNHSVSASSLSFKVDPATNYAVLTAPESGIIHSVDYQAGSYAPAGGVVADMVTNGSLYVTASFHLSPPDYARINKNSQLDLKFPDNSTRKAQIYAINLTPDHDAVDTVVKARVKDIDMSDFQFAVGTPVNATLHLKQAHWYESLANFIEQLFQPMGR